MKEISNKRWKLAQDSEQDFWNSFTTKQIRENHEKAYKREVEIFSKRWKKFIPLNKNIKILQIGCGPLDIINYLPYGKIYSIDPLAEFYKKKFKFDYKKSNLISAPGEKLPYDDNFFDLVIFGNVLDHTNDADKVLSEIKRVLKKDGIMHFECAYYQNSFLALSKVYGFFKKMITKEIFNIHHPYMFSLRELKYLVKKHFKTYDERICERVGQEIYTLKDLKKFRLKQKFTVKVPAIFGMFGNINYSCICKLKK